MDFAFLLYFIIAAAIVFIIIFVTGPVLYTVWFDNLRNDIPNTTYGNRLASIGDLYFSEYQILGFLVPGIIIAWGFAAAASRGAQTDVQEYEY